MWGWNQCACFECARSDLEACARVTNRSRETDGCSGNESLSAERFQTFVLMSFGIAALLLAIDQLEQQR